MQGQPNLRPRLTACLLDAQDAGPILQPMTRPGYSSSFPRPIGRAVKSYQTRLPIQIEHEITWVWVKILSLFN